MSTQLHVRTDGKKSGMHVHTDVLPKIIEGISPEVALTPELNGLRIDVTTKTGTKTAFVPKGETGATPNFQIGTVSTLNPGQPATAFIGGTAENPVLNLGIPKGETGSADNVYGSTLPMSPSDSTKVSEAIDGKVDADQGAANAGKALGIDNTGAVVPIPFPEEDFTGATASTAGVHGYVPAPAIAEREKYLKGDGTWSEVPDPQVMTGATASAAGTSGLVPAPSVGDATRYLRSDGTWSVPPDTHVTVDGAFSTTSQNPVENRVVNSAFESVEDSIAIVANRNTHGAITAGQYVYVKNHYTLAEGLYKATAAVEVNGALSTSNLAADTNGGLNDLQSQVTALNSKITNVSTATITIPGDASQRTIDFSKVGRLVQINIRCDISREFADGEVIASVPDGYAPRATTDFPIFGTGGAFLGVMRINAGKTITPVFGSLKTGSTRCTFMYLSE